jgi:hypothetical protein
MMKTEQNGGLLKAIGMAVVRINGVEEVLKHFLAFKLVSMNPSTMTDELKKMETSTFGDKLKIFDEKILPKHVDLRKLYDKLDQLNEKRVLLDHVAIVEEVTLDKDKIPHPTGQFVFLPYVKRHGNIPVPMQPANESEIHVISELAEDVGAMIRETMVKNFNTTGTGSASA